ncbi:hypothetical protein H5P28_17020 [Ruficoccus amylovorans]|uniref:Uncharacterized protein n=1 Tax=Ruficoccus amylovorans TaxID=1804625 RepID=A0A842HIJ0_9BACT|nr:hypothetical protein [Ruficoccus amylovorans]MBC2595970.1 hypothetical protein [Ruficoccus amylovorans]
MKAETILEWDFTQGSQTAESWLTQWTPESDAARLPEAVRVAAPPGNVIGDHSALVIEDIDDSSNGSRNDAAGTPTFSCSFAPVDNGTLSFRAGTSGTQNQHAIFTLLSGKRTLLVIKLIGNTTGEIVSGTGKTEFSDGKSWYNRARDFAITWTDKGEVSVSFTPEQGAPLKLDHLKFISPGRPDCIQIQVGYGKATGKAVRLESFSLKTNE